MVSRSKMEGKRSITVGGFAFQTLTDHGILSSKQNELRQRIQKSHGQNREQLPERLTNFLRFSINREIRKSMSSPLRLAIVTFVVPNDAMQSEKIDEFFPTRRLRHLLRWSVVHFPLS